MPGTAVTIGAYDGVHLGHRALLRDLSARADAAGLSTAVVTFDRHPAGVVRPESAPLQLTDLEQKLELLAACGVDRTVVIAFDQARAAESAEEFVKEELVDKLGAKLVVVGEDFHFGHGRKGNVALLTELGRQYGFEVVGATLTGASLTGDGRTDAVSSTRIRTLVAEGDVIGAAQLSWDSRPPTSRSATTSRSRPTGSTPGSSRGPTARSTRPQSLSDGGPRSMSRARLRSWWRPISSILRATSTAN
jgi:riboflavin kinase/FMN adenylyltransferase